MLYHISLHYYSIRRVSKLFFFSQIFFLHWYIYKCLYISPFSLLAQSNWTNPSSVNLSDWQCPWVSLYLFWHFFLNFRSPNLYPELIVFHSRCQSSFSCSLFSLCSHLVQGWNLVSYETGILVLLQLNPFFTVISLSSTCTQAPISPSVRNTIIRAGFFLQDSNSHGLLRALSMWPCCLYGRKEERQTLYIFPEWSINMLCTLIFLLKKTLGSLHTAYKASSVLWYWTLSICYIVYRSVGLMVSLWKHELTWGALINVLQSTQHPSSTAPVHSSMQPLCAKEGPKNPDLPKYFYITNMEPSEVLVSAPGTVCSFIQLLPEQKYRNSQWGINKTQKHLCWYCFAGICKHFIWCHFINQQLKFS